MIFLLLYLRKWRRLDKRELGEKEHSVTSDLQLLLLLCKEHCVGLENHVTERIDGGGLLRVADDLELVLRGLSEAE